MSWSKEDGNWPTLAEQRREKRIPDRMSEASALSQISLLFRLYNSRHSAALIGDLGLDSHLNHTGMALVTSLKLH